MSIIESKITTYDRSWNERAWNRDGYDLTVFHPSSFQRNSVREGVSLPNYRAIIRARGDASTSYSRWSDAVSFSYSIGNIDFVYQYGSDPSTGVPLYGPGGYEVYSSPATFPHGTFLGSYQETIPPDVYNLLVVKFLNKVRSVRRSFDGNTNLGEMRETLHGIRNPAQALRSSLSEYLRFVEKRTRGLKTLKKVVDVARQTYLEYAFGWRPIVQAIDDAGKALNKLVDTVNDTERTGVSAAWLRRDVFNHPSPVSASWFVFDLRTEVVYENSAKIYGIISRRLDRPLSARFKEGLGLTPKDWLPAAWELLPFSFITDYFLNIGNCLSAAGTVTDDIISCGMCIRSNGIYHTYAKFNASATRSSVDSYLALYHGHSTSVHCTDSHIVFNQHAFTRDVLNKNDFFIIPTFQFPSLPVQWLNLGALSKEMVDISKTVFRR